MGFTLVEMVVAIAIIGVLASVALTSMSAARSNSRDKIRLVDIEQLKLGFKLYEEYWNAYPSYDGGVAIGDGGSIDAELASVEVTAPVDPTHDGTTYMYVYDSDFNCTENGQKVIYINNFETLKSSSNAESLCSVGSDAVEGQFIIILE